MSNLTIEERRKRIETIAKWGAVPLLGFFVAPFIFIAIKGAIGLIIALALGLTAVQLLPWFAAKVANWRLKAIKAEAAKNPVETLQNEYQRRAEDLAHFNEKLRVFIAKVSEFGDKVHSYTTKYPQDAASFQEQLTKMKQLLALRKTKFQEAKANLVEFNAAIERAKDKWEMSQAALAMALEAGQTEAEFFAKIQTETALDSVQESMNKAFADLELSLLDEEKPAVKQEFQNRVADGVETATIPNIQRQKIAVT